MVTPIQAEATPSRGGSMLIALRHRDYRLFWTGAILSNIGTWMQAVAQSLLVLHLTNSAFWLGFDGFMATAPGVPMALLGGVLGDMVERKRLLILTQIVAGFAALLLGLLIYAGVVHVWMVLVLSFLTGSCMSLAAPSYQALTFDIVGREDLTNAIALNSTQFQISRVVGPVLAPLTISAFGLAGCFLANGLSYVAIVVALVLTRPRSRVSAAPGARGKRIWPDLLEGFRYVLTRPAVSVLLLISAVVSLFGSPYFTMIPIFARDLIGQGGRAVAIMMGTVGAGALCGALLLAFLGNFQHKGYFVTAEALVFSACLVIFSLSGTLQFSLPALFGAGFSMVGVLSVINMLLQDLISDEMRGRVMGLFVISFIGMMPLGNLIAGAASTRYGAHITIACGGMIMGVIILLVSIRFPRIRQL